MRSNLLPRFERNGSSRGYYGFGYDELSNDYKVVITGIELKMATITYSLKTGKWKEIGHFPCAHPLDDGKLLNAALHWVAGKRTTSGSRKIVSLDLAKETYGEILQPEYRKGYNYFELGVSGEWLCVLHDCYESWVVDVWVMKVYGVKDFWTKLASISIKTLEARIRILEGQLEMERHPENHTLESAAILHEIYNGMGNLNME
ncbi:F-box associated domain containing protein [Tanacetum coccineum]